MGLLQLIVVVTAILATSASAQNILDVEDPDYLSDDQLFSSEQIEDQKKDPEVYDDYDFNSSELAELLKNEPDSNDYEQELDDLMDSINSEEVDLEEEEEEEEDHFLHLLNILEDLDNTEEEDNLEDPVDPEDECDDIQCNGEIITSPNLDEDTENGRRHKRSPSPGFRRSSSSRSSSSGSSSSRSSSSRSSSSRSSPSRSSSSRSSSSRSSSSRSSSPSRSSSGTGWFRRSSSRGSSTSRGSGSTSTSRGSTGSSSGSTSSSTSSGKPSTGTAVLAGAGTGAAIGVGTGAAIGATSGSSNSGSKPGSGYPVQPSGGYPTGTQPASGYPTGTQPAGGYPTGTQPASGYPTGTQPAGGYPTGTQPVAGYPTGTKPSGGYPTGTQPASGYPTGTQPAGGYPTGTQPVAGYPTGTNPSGGYPTGTQPASGYPTGTQPAGGYPTGTQPVAGYPTGTRPSGGYPTGTQPAPGYPTGTQPVGGYPTGTQPVGGYPTGTRPVGGYPTGTQPVAGYPTGTQPGAGYPTGTRPVGGYPTGTQPGGGYPTGTRPVGGYPTGTQPGAGYPTGTYPGGSYPTHTQPAVYPGYSLGSRPFGSSHQPYGGYPAGNQPYGGGGGYPGHQPYGGGYSGYQPSGGYPAGGFPTSSHTYGGYPSGGFSRGGFSRGGLAAGGLAAGGLAAGAGFAAGGFAAGGYPAGGYPMPKRKKSKKEKAVGLISSVATAYAVRKAHKKNKFLSPFGHSGGRGMGGMGMGIGGGLAGAAAGMAVGKTAKKILGAYVKIQIAKYALKFGAKAAKAYFEYKLGRELDEYMIGKFVHRYHQHRVRGSSRWRHRTTYYEKSSSSNNETDNVTLGEFCHRPCNESIKLVCQFQIEVHLYQTMSRACYNCPSNITDCERPECVPADGTRRMVTAVNKAIPGPAIEVCAGDKVLVDVLNNLPSTALTIHWHGITLGRTQSIKNARSTPFMDGAPGVTQCPIAPGSAFRYSFDATDPGTHFWHAQTGMERGDGVFGPLIVHQSMDKDPMLSLPEHIFVVNDWFHAPTQVKYVMKQNSGEEAKPKSILINGQGRHQHDGSSAQIPYFNFIVEKNRRYRLRIINAASTNCPVTISIDSHELILLSADGSAVNPVNTSTLLIHPGERYDAMFSAEQESGDDGATFWVRVDGGNDCKGLEQFASLQYLPTNLTGIPLPTVAPDINPSTTPSTTPGRKVFTGSCNTPGQRCLPHLRSSVSLHQAVTIPKATYTFYLAFSKRNIHNENFYSLLFYNVDDDEVAKKVATPQINYLSFRGTSTPLLVNQRPLKSENCSSEGVRRGQCTEDFCECLHVLQVPVGAIVDLVLIGEGNGDGMSEPVHLHGYKFWVLAQVEAASVPELIIPESENITLPEGMSREKVIRLDEDNRLERYLESPVMKDTVAIPPGGYAITRIVAENIGFWVLESQVLFNSQAGMSLVLQVGAPADLPKAPKDFPTC